MSVDKLPENTWRTDRSLVLVLVPLRSEISWLLAQLIKAWIWHLRRYQTARPAEQRIENRAQNTPKAQRFLVRMRRLIMVMDSPVTLGCRSFSRSQWTFDLAKWLAKQMSAGSDSRRRLWADNLPISGGRKADRSWRMCAKWA